MNRNIVVCLPDIHGGGAEHQGALLADSLSGKGHQVFVFLTKTSHCYRWPAGAQFSETLTLPSHASPQAYKSQLWWQNPPTRVLENFPGTSTWAKGARVGYRIFLRFRFGAIPRSLYSRLRELDAIHRLRHVLASLEAPVVIALLARPSVIASLASTKRSKLLVSLRNNPVKQGVPRDIARAFTGAVRSADGVLANSREAVSAIQFQFPNKPVRYTPNDYSRLIVHPPSQRADRNVLWVGRLEPQKRPLEALEAFAKSGATRFGWKLHYYGAGSLAEELLRRVKDLRLERSVRLHGKVPPSEIPYRAAVTLILSSDYEGSANVFFEAVAAGALVLVREGLSDAEDFVAAADVQEVLLYAGWDHLTRQLSDLELLRSNQATVALALQEQLARYIARAKSLNDDFHKWIASGLRT